MEKEKLVQTTVFTILIGKYQGMMLSLRIVIVILLPLDSNMKTILL